MFTIYADDRVLWTPKDPNKLLLSPTLSLEVNKVGSFTFKILPTHEFYDSLALMTTIISVVQDDRITFKGRVYSDDRDFRNIKKIKAEGLLGYFNDSIVRPYDFSGSPEEFLSMLITQHNSQVEEWQRFKRGRVTVSTDDYIVRSSSDLPTTWKEITDKLIAILGGYIVIRYEADGNYIDYLADYEDVSTQDIAFSVNLLDLTQSAKSDELITCLIPRGSKDEEGKEIDITSVNDGLDYIIDADAVDQYGRIFGTAKFEDITSPAELLENARTYLTNKVRLPSEIAIKAIDLHLTDDAIESFKIGDYIRVYSEPHKIDERILLTSYSMDLSDPANCSITLNTVKTSYLGDVSRGNVVQANAIRQEINQVSNRISPILEEGDIGIWHYIKYYSGYVELWGSVDKLLTISTSYPGGYYISISDDLPFKLLTVKRYDTSVRNSIQGITASSGSVLGTYATAWIMSATDSASMIELTVDYYIYGQWRFN